MISPEAGDTATVVKLFRVMLLMPVVLLISLIYRSHQSADGKKPNVPLIPGLLMVFVVMVLLHHLGWCLSGWCMALPTLRERVWFWRLWQLE
jgi:uncharacterized membrane protein YadS